MSNLYGDIGLALGTTANVFTIGYSLYNIFKVQIPLTPTYAIYLEKKRDVHILFLGAALAIVVLYFVLNYTVIRKEMTITGWFDWIYMIISVIVAFLSLVYYTKLNPCSQIMQAGINTFATSTDATRDINL